MISVMAHLAECTQASGKHLRYSHYSVIAGGLGCRSLLARLMSASNHSSVPRRALILMSPRPLYVLGSIFHHLTSPFESLYSPYIPDSFPLHRQVTMHNPDERGM